MKTKFKKKKKKKKKKKTTTTTVRLDTKKKGNEKIVIPNLRFLAPFHSVPETRAITSNSPNRSKAAAAAADGGANQSPSSAEFRLTKNNKIIRN